MLSNAGWFPCPQVPFELYILILVRFPPTAQNSYALSSAYL
jgi:hypothetical protein